MKSCRRWLAPAIAALACVAFGATTAIDPAVYLDDIKFLASMELRGRETGSPELEKAAVFIAERFREFGLQPLGDRNYLQAFPATGNAQLGKTNSFQFVQNGRTTRLRLQNDFIPFAFSSASTFSGAVVFAGYGITAPEYHYDDYDGLDVKGKVVLILRHEPQESDEHSVFAGREFTRHAAFTSKASNAKMHGAAAVILINDRSNHRADPDKLEPFKEMEGPADAGIPFVQVKEERVDGWFAAAGKKLDAIAQDIDKTLKPESFAFPDTIRVDSRIDLKREVKTVHNVSGYLPGETGEYLIIGAHYDHLGLGERFSLAPRLAGTIHPGADDNASGTAGVIELARWFARQPRQKRGIVFLAFAGEEQGLLGSQYWVEHPELPLDQAVAMINMDMIGRVRDGKVYIGGAETGAGMRTMMEKIAPRSALKLDFSNVPNEGSSDHTSFLAKSVPSLFFFSGLHGDYHKPSDTWDKIDAPGAVKVLELVAQTAGELCHSGDRFQFVRVAPPAAHGGGDAGPVSSSSGSGYGPYFGSVPDFGEGTKGVKFADVRDGSPAAKAGLRAGDVMVEFDGKPIENLYDFTYALRAKKPGDDVHVKVLRDGKPLEATVHLTARD